MVRMGFILFLKIGLFLLSLFIAINSYLTQQSLWFIPLFVFE